MSLWDVSVDRAVRIVMTLLVIGGIVAVVIHANRPAPGVEAFLAANPGWTLDHPENSPVRLNDASGRGEVLIAPDDIGPHRAERVDCAEVQAAFPSWFSLPDAPIGNCLRLHDTTPPTLVLNMRTTLTVHSIWDRGYQPTLDRLRLGHHGGRSGRFQEAEDTDKPGSEASGFVESGSLFYSVDPPPGSADRTVSIVAYARAGTTQLIFSFRTGSRP
ncbi:MAG: hypothetical protein ABI699_14025 [Caldimonas sp.]